MPNTLDNQVVTKALELLQKSSAVLIALPKNVEPDAVGSALALAQFIKKVNPGVKAVDVACESGNFSQLDFLAGTIGIKKVGKLPRKFTVTINTHDTKVEEISYTSPTADALEIEIVPKGGNFTASDVSFSQQGVNYDTIVTLDTPSLDMLGELYSQNAEIFFAAAKVNIDSHVTNANYGDANLVGITVASTSEVAYELIKNYVGDAGTGVGVVSPEMATALLTGIISKTNSFQSASTTPDAFHRASELVQLGASQQEIIRALFKTRSFSMMKLWGRAMARIKALPELSTVYSTVSAEDVERSGASAADVLAAAREFSKNAGNIGDAKLLFLFIETGAGSEEFYISSNPNVKLSELCTYFGGELISPNICHATFPDTATPDYENLLAEMYGKLKDTIGL